MKIIHPYGRSTVTSDAPTRQIIPNAAKGSAVSTAQPIENFAKGNAALVLAQWVSMIDKIAAKPKGKTPAHPAQRDLREKLAQALWQRLAPHLQNDCGETDIVLWKKRWDFKVHPYTVDDKPKDPDTVPKLTGRWYARFVGDTEPSTLTEPDFQVIAERIEGHLYQKAQRLGLEKPHNNGLIAKRATSISRSTARYTSIVAKPWTEDNETDYFSKADIASIIYQKAKAVYDLAEKESKERKKLPHIPLSLAAAELYQHWKTVFDEPNATEAKAQQPALLALHDAIKATYTKILKEQHKKDKLAALPENKTTLLNLVNNQYQNQDVNALIRQGKVIYYGGENNNQDYYKTSDGQTEIKRAEAFVRVWRNVIGQANLTLSSWASMKKIFKEDILGQSKNSTTVTDDNFDTTLFDKNIALVFGNDADLFTTDDDLRKATLKSAISGMIALRNSGFHFKGLPSFLAKLFDLSDVENFEKQVLEAPLLTLWQRANDSRHQRLLAVLHGAYALHYCQQKQVQQLVDVLCTDHSSHIALPRFSRLLARHANIQKYNNNGQVISPKYGMPPLPPVANRLDLEQKPAQKCQYIALKLLYERAFRAWLEKDSTPVELERWIKTALERASNAAKSLNADGNADKRLLIQARAESLPCLKKGQSIRQFFDGLTAASASEMRVQRGYHSDAEAAREQAEYIDDLWCDVVALAFKDFLSFQRLRWVLDMDHTQALPNTLCCPTDNIRLPQPKQQTETWQRVLFFLLYLIPVGEASQLLHQLTRWELSKPTPNATNPVSAENLMALQYTLKLYLDVHDSQYSSLVADGKSMPLIEREQLAVFTAFYEHENVFNRLFPEQGNGLSTQLYLPQRELREVRRFGHIPVLRALHSEKITGKAVTSCLNNEVIPTGKKLSVIAEAHQQREALHQQWIQKKHQFKDYQRYCETLKVIIEHRRLVQQCYLINLVSAHRIIMKVLTRLADFSGLFERDLSMVTLKKIDQANLKKEEFFKSSGIKLFKNGQIFESLGSGVLAVKKGIKVDIFKCFLQNVDNINEEDSKVESNFLSKKGIRNGLAHFKMLESNSVNLNTPLNLNLTHWVNQTRELVAYDRKLKNAVSKSIIELMAREGFELTWEMDANHQLTNAKLKSRTITHLAGKKIPLTDKLPNGKNKMVNITEALHGNDMVKMLAGVFAATPLPARDITHLDMTKVDWKNIR